VKLAKPGQDLRFDVPVVGLRTLETMVASNVRVLAVEAEKTLMIDREKLISGANAHGIAIVAVE
jgi:hypothetical protein